MRVYVPKARKPTSVQSLPEMSSASGLMRSSSSTRRSTHWDILDSARNISWIRGSLSTIGKNLIGPYWTFVKVKEFEDEATPEALTALKRFYGVGVKRDHKNIKDFYTTASKFYATAVSYVMGGFAGWELRKNKLGEYAGFDYVPGYIEPQIDDNGDFLSPAWRQFLSGSELQSASWNDPQDIVFFANPDFGGYPCSQDMEALVGYTLPSEIHAMLSYLSIHKNRSAPLDGTWEIDSNVDNDVFDKVYAMLRARYTGSGNYGRTPLLSKGTLKFNPARRFNEDAPYLEGRNYNRQEMAAVTNVPGSKLGVTQDLSMANSREAKRDYFETAIEPLQIIIEDTSYQQIHVDLLDIRGWKLSFNNPAFTNEIEQASIDRTYWNIGERSANEIRERGGKEPRDGGDEYFSPANMIPADGANDPIPDQPNDPVPPGTSNPAGQKPRPPRADEQALLAELKKFKTVALKRMKESKKPKKFETEIIPEALYMVLSSAIESVESEDEIKEIFMEVETRIKGATDG